MPEKPTRCIKCNAPLTQPPTGRPRTYCGPACRQSGAYELQRLQRRLESLETQASRLRHEPDRGIRDMAGRLRPEQLAAVEAEIADAESRLRLLLPEQRRLAIGRHLEATP